MTVVSKSKLKARMLEYFREVERTGEPLIVTDGGREVLEVRPLKPAKDGNLRLGRVRAALFGPGGTSPVEEATLLEPEWEQLFFTITEEEASQLNGLLDKLRNSTD